MEEHAPLVGQVCVITGASAGIGQAAALALASEGAEVVIVCRNGEKGEAVAQVCRQRGGKSAVVVADLASLAAIAAAAKQIRERYPAIHVLINNAGGYCERRETTPDGFERTFAVNHLAYFALTEHLYPLLQASARADRRARVVNVASMAHHTAKIDWQDLHLERGFDPLRAYSNSKLANIWFTRELARRAAKHFISANCLHPGIVSSNFAQGQRTWMSRFYKWFRPLLRTPERAAQELTFLASSSEVETVSGGFFASKRQRQPSKMAQDDRLAAQMWDVCEKLTGLTIIV